MASNQKCPSQKKKECVKLGEWASSQLAELGASKTAKQLSAQTIESLMGSLQIADSKN